MEKSKQKVIINRRLNLDGTWQKYRISPPTAYGKILHKNANYTSLTLDRIIDFYNLQNVRELGVKYTYDNKDQKYGIESYEAYLLNQNKDE
tara:strand:+ start:499 stop:771 length:273 start_codon:yes stop_codon:yes gene_type:complete